MLFHYRSLAVSAIFSLTLLSALNCYLSHTEEDIEIWQTFFVVNTNPLINPERGAYAMIEYSTSSWSSASFSLIQSYISSYSLSLLLMKVYLDSGLTSVIDQSALDKIDAEFGIYRASGVKAIVRFVYNSDYAGYGDVTEVATTDLAYKQIEALTPILQKNEDVIAFMQAGIIGAWGEWFYTDVWGDQCEGDATYAKLPICSSADIAARAKVVSLLQSALPTKHIQIRTPAWIFAFFGTTPPTAPDDTPGSKGRIAFHNDCYLDGDDEGGTWDDPAQQPIMSEWTKYVPYITETCALASPYSDCDNALLEGQQFHLVSSSRLYNELVWNSWVSGGCYDTIMNSMGYRLSIVTSSVSLDTVLHSSSSSRHSQSSRLAPTLTVSATISNTGWAAPSNKRKIEVILRNVLDSEICVATLPDDIRNWLPGSNSLSSVVSLPSDINVGRWEVLLQFSDPYPSLYGVPWYKIQTANDEIFETGTGLHKLYSIIDVIDTELHHHQHRIVWPHYHHSKYRHQYHEYHRVRSNISSSSSSLSSTSASAQCGFQLSDIVNATVIAQPDGTCHDGYYLPKTTDDNDINDNNDNSTFAYDSVKTSKTSKICTWCPPGYECKSGNQPQQCVLGTWSAGGQSSCLSCMSASCGNHGVCQASSGACLCDAGYSGFDCSISNIKSH